MTALRAIIGLAVIGVLAAGAGYLVVGQRSGAVEAQAPACNSCDARKAGMARARQALNPEPAAD